MTSVKNGPPKPPVFAISLQISVSWFSCIFQQTARGLKSYKTGEEEQVLKRMAEKQRIIVPRVKMGSQGFEVSKLGFGCMGLTGMYNDPVPEEVGISIIRHAFDNGITFFDTSDGYGPHTNEILIGKYPHRGFPGRTTKISNLDNNIDSLRVKLTNEDLEEISAAIPISEVAGSRLNDNFVGPAWKFANTPAKDSHPATKSK
ncbi:hypothetical protein Pint_20517 [Pistacia integerrima]|uniref:Uncharacterized protein n=1 Tax=Pistacia integerrima TaxID=434235 RepID=A0ACC0XDC2_9ROSI|nr:hypothetical protein Pint_20517 [Pistacia integerrima]